MSQRQPASRFRELHEETATVVELHGDIDVVMAASLWARLQALIDGPDRELIVDLRPVTFIDCSGLGVLCGANNRLLTLGRRLRLVVTRPLVVQLLRLFGLDRTFVVSETLADAYACFAGTAVQAPAVTSPIADAAVTLPQLRQAGRKGEINSGVQSTGSHRSVNC